MTTSTISTNAAAYLKQARAFNIAYQIWEQHTDKPHVQHNLFTQYDRLKTAYAALATSLQGRALSFLSTEIQEHHRKIDELKSDYFANGYAEWKKRASSTTKNSASDDDSYFVEDDYDSDSETATTSSTTPKGTGSKIVPITLGKLSSGKTAPASAKEASLEGWGDKVMEIMWLLIDFLGTIRNGMSVYTAFAGIAAAPWVIVAIPLLAAIGGPLCVLSAIRDTIPGACNDLSDAIELGKIEREFDKENGVASYKYVTEGETVASIGLANQIMFAVIGAALTAYAAVGLMGPTVGHIMHWTPALSAGAATAAGLAMDGIFGGTCLVRGGIMVARGVYNLNYIVPFQFEFMDALSRKHPLDAGIKMLEDTWSRCGGNKDEKLGIEHFKRRAGAEVAEKMAKYMKDPSLKNSIEFKIDLLKTMDKGIFTQKAKQVLIIFIGLLMISGAVACLVASGGIVGVAVLASISISFMLMEAGWLGFDWSWLFHKFADAIYKEPDYISNLTNSKFDQLTAQKFPRLKSERLNPPELKFREDTKEFAS